MASGTKVCFTCKEGKKAECFHKDKSKKSGLAASCKSCRKVYTKNYYRENKKSILKNTSEYAKNNREVNREATKKYRKENKEEVNQRTRERWYENHEYNKKRIREWQKDKLKTDPLFKLKTGLRSYIKGSLRNNGYSKKSKTYEVLGETYEKVLQHLNDNPYGFVYGVTGIDLDHIMPLSTAKSEEEILKLNHYKNLQLLPSVYNQNIKRGNTFNRNHFEEWLKQDKK